MPAVCVAPDRCIGQADRLDDVDDRHHRTQPHPAKQLSASYERFTTVLEALDASVSVAPAGQRGTAVRQQAVPPVVWHTTAKGHLQLVEQAGMPEQRSPATTAWTTWTVCRTAHRHA
jgi:hypothetical protein